MYTSGRELEHGYGVHGTVSGGAFISTGVIGWPAFAAMEKLKTHGVECFCVDIWRLKPVNWDKLISTISGADWFVFLDESVKLVAWQKSSWQLPKHEAKVRDKLRPR